MQCSRWESDSKEPCPALPSTPSSSTELHPSFAEPSPIPSSRVLQPLPGLASPAELSRHLSATPFSDTLLQRHLSAPHHLCRPLMKLLMRARTAEHIPCPQTPGLVVTALPNPSRHKESLRIRTKCFGNLHPSRSAHFVVPVPRVEPEEGFWTGDALRGRVSFGRAPQTNTSTRFASFSWFHEHQFQNGSCGCVFIGAKPAWETQGERERERCSRVCKAAEIAFPWENFSYFCSSLGNLGRGEEGLTLESPKEYQCWVFSISPEQ